MLSNDYDFPIYASIYYDIHGWDIPQVHYDIFQYLENEQKWGNEIKTKELLLWRGIGKSTITDLWVSYKITKNPKLRFLILSADGETAQKSSREILSILQMHPLSKDLIPNKKAELIIRQNAFWVRGNRDKRTPSVKSLGILSNATGSRADYIIYDDVEVSKNSGSDKKRYELRKKISESNRYLSPEVGRRLFIGTYHDSVSIYDEEIENGASQLKVPLLKNVHGDFPFMMGDSQWPERFDEEWVLTEQKKCTGKSEWLSQYMLEPTSFSDAILDPSLFVTYSNDIEFVTVNKTAEARLKLFNQFEEKFEDVRLLSASCWWDPAFSSARGDDSVICCVYTDISGKYFVHAVKKLVGTPDDQCIQAKEFAVLHRIPIIRVEENGIGKMLPPILMKYTQSTGIGVQGVYTKQGQSKGERIITTLETPLYASRIYIHESVKDSPFLNQVRDFSPDNNKSKDDYIDAVASCIGQEPVRMQINTFSKELFGDWMRGDGGSHDFELEMIQF